MQISWFYNMMHHFNLIPDEKRNYEYENKWRHIMTEQELRDIESFTWNSKCTEDQVKRMQALREAGKALCEQIIKDVPNSADRSAGIRSLRLAIMQCNLAIAHEGYKP